VLHFVCESKGNLLTLCERKTRFTLAAPLERKAAEESDTMLRTILGSLPQPAWQSITFDNG
jgi:IS30 family transposase